MTMSATHQTTSADNSQTRADLAMPKTRIVKVKRKKKRVFKNSRPPAIDKIKIYEQDLNV